MRQPNLIDKMPGTIALDDGALPTKSPRTSVFSKGRFRRPKTAGATADEKSKPFATAAMPFAPSFPPVTSQLSRSSEPSYTERQPLTPKEEVYVEPTIFNTGRRESLVRFQEAELGRERSRDRQEQPARSVPAIERKPSNSRDLLPSLSIKSSLFPTPSSSSPVSVGVGEREAKEKTRRAPPANRRRPKTSDSVRPRDSSFGLMSSEKGSLMDDHRLSLYHSQTSLDGFGISQGTNIRPSVPEEEEELDDKLDEDLLHYTLPVRLGLVHPSHLSSSARKKLFRKDQPFPQCPMTRSRRPYQYCQGYFLCTAPPMAKEKQMASPSPSVPELPTPDRFLQRYQLAGRGRSNSDAVLPDQSRNSILMMNRRDSDKTPRWKLHQYFRSYRKKTPFGTKEYKFHAYEREDACYWWGYNIKTLVAETLKYNIINSFAGLSILDFSKEPPSRVLDIGTGVGNWAIDAARQWKDAEVVGLDLVPVQTPLESLQDDDLQLRVSWVVANVLQGLPFPDNSFDYIHIRQLNMGIPEDQWANVLAEVIRVLTPDGQLEILETDWTFLGTPKEILTKDLQALLSGEKQSHEKIKMWKRRPQNPFDDLEAAVEQMLQRRMIKSDPGSVIPFHLASLDATSIGHGVPRHFPLLARSSLYRANEASESQEGEKAVEWTPKVKNADKAFIARPQIGQPLPPHHFKFQNLDTLRMAMLVTDVTRVSEARDLVWQEMQADKENSSMAINPRWATFGEFERDMDQWYDDMISRADLENLLKSTFDWNEAATRMDNRMSQHREMKRLRKMEASEKNTLHGLANGQDCSLGDTSNVDQSLGNVTATNGGIREENRQDSTDSDQYASDQEQHGNDDQAKEEERAQLYKKSTAILAFRTSTVFTARKKAQ